VQFRCHRNIFIQDCILLFSSFLIEINILIIGNLFTEEVETPWDNEKVIPSSTFNYGQKNGFDVNDQLSFYQYESPFSEILSLDNSCKQYFENCSSTEVPTRSCFFNNRESSLKKDEEKVEKVAEKEEKADESSGSYSKIVDNIIKSEEVSKKKFNYRKDVVNKRIVRHFRKYILNLFHIENKMPCRNKRPVKVLKKEIIDQAIDIGIINVNNPDENNTEYKEFVSWMAMDKKTTKTKRMFNYKNESIRILSDMLGKYSHTKLENVYKDENTARLFAFFVKKGTEEFLSQFSGESRSIYKKNLEEFCKKFGIHQC